MEKLVKAVLFILLVLYVVSPVDLMVGPIDDAILTVIYIIANVGIGKLKELNGSN